eukprot:TRINITY_DN2623_c0_g1_i1.p1 TRINITY_DN2623_c0_g1~~TRINITY_DN2623_c0_g1_i1.p1  ORF type:complete len:148 (-),score=51.98 TRINITY_DN2623_c0_g1_i1:33-476(-)
MAEMTEFEKKRAAAQKAAEDAQKAPKKPKQKKVLTPEQIQAQLEEEKRLVREFYHKKYEDIALRSERVRRAETHPEEKVDERKESEAEAPQLDESALQRDTPTQASKGALKATATPAKKPEAKKSDAKKSDRKKSEAKGDKKKSKGK